MTTNKIIKNDLGDFLVKQRILSASQLTELRQRAEVNKRSLEDVILEQGKILPADLLKAKSSFYNFPAVELSEQEIKGDVLKLIPLEFAQYYQIVPFSQQNNEVWLALVHPENFKALEAVEILGRQHGWKPRYALTTNESLMQVLRQYSTIMTEVSEVLKMTEEEDQKALRGETKEIIDFEQVIKAAPVSKMVSVILRHAVERGASDVHIEPGEADTRVRFRIDGVLHTLLTLPKYIHAAVVSRVKVLATLKIDETRVPQDGRIRLKILNKVIDFRVSILPVVGNEKVVMRILDPTTGVRTFEGLGFTGYKLRVLNEAINKPHGMFLVTGPTGSGKTTTLYAVLNILNHEDVNIITLEDPVEYFLSGVSQSQVNPEVGYTFASGLRSILRQDPDIIMVGEIRDPETAELAIHTSLTGHILLSTLHTNDAISAIPRLIDMHQEPFLLASTINVIVAQRLARRLCERCRQPVDLAAEIVAKIKKEFEMMGEEAKQEIPKEPWQIFKAKGCNQCENTGYKGRVAISEVLLNTPKLQKCIVEGAKPYELKEEFIAQGGTNLMQDGYFKLLAGLTSLEEVISVAQE